MKTPIPLNPGSFHEIILKLLSEPITTILEPDELYTREPDEEEMQAWDRLMPRKQLSRICYYVMEYDQH